MSASHHPAANCPDNARRSEIATAIVRALEAHGETWTSRALHRAGFHVDHPERQLAHDVLHALCEMGVLELTHWHCGRVYVDLL